MHTVTAAATDLITLRRAGLRVGEDFFAPAFEPTEDLDILREVGYTEVDDPTQWTEHQVVHIDLNRPTCEIFGGFDRNTRAAVLRAAQEDQIVCEFDDRPSPESLDVFVERHDRYAAARGVHRAYRGRLDILAAADMLTVSRASNEALGVEAVHVYLRNRDRFMLLYSMTNVDEVSGMEARCAVSRANKLLHWASMKHAQELGCTVYDLGGVDIAESTQAGASEAWLKRGFGGETRSTYTRVVPCSARGRITLSVLDRVGKPV